MRERFQCRSYRRGGGGDLSSLRAAAGNDPAGRLLELAEAVKGMTGT